MVSKLSHDMAFYTLFTHSPKITLAFLPLSMPVSHQIRYSSLEHVFFLCFLAFSFPLSSYLPFKIIHSSISYFKEAFSNIPFPRCPELTIPLLCPHDAQCLPWLHCIPTTPLCISLPYKKNERLRIRISSKLFLYSQWLGKKQKKC